MQKLAKPFVVSLARKYSQPAAKIHLSGIDAAPVINQLPNGCTVASVENGSPSSRIGVVVNMGTRYESRANEGIAHLIKNSTNLSSGKSSGFVFTRQFQQTGASVACTLTREHMVFNIECLRSAVPECLEYIATVIQAPVFHPWELKSAEALSKLDLHNVSHSPAITLMDALHKAAYRDGLGRGLVMPDHRLGTHSSEDCLAFVADKYVPANIAIVGTGVDDGVFLKTVQSAFGFSKKDTRTSEPAKTEPAVYHGGETRLDNNNSLVHFCIAAEGSALNDKRMLPFAVLMKALGSGPSVKYSDNSTSILAKAGASVTDNPFAINTINANYTDTGLIGLYGIAHAPDVRKITMAMFNVLNQVGDGVLNEEDVLRGKNLLKASLLFDLEDSVNLVTDMGIQALLSGKILESDDMIAAIDAVTLEDVLACSSKIPEGKFTMASVGKLHETPFVDELK